MRFFLIAALVGFSGIHAWVKGQTVVGQFQPPNPEEELLDFQVAAHPNSGFGICFTDEANFVVQALDGTGGSIFQKTIPSDDAGYSALGSLVRKEAYIFVYNDALSTDLVMVTAPLDKEQPLSLRSLQVEEKNEILFGSIVSHNELYSVVWNKSKHQLKLGRYDVAKEGFETKFLPIADELAKKMKQELFTPISDATVMTPELAIKTQKLYLLDRNRLAMTLEGENFDSCQTELVILDWATGQLEKHNLGLPVTSARSKNSTNSFVNSGYISLYKIGKERMELSILSLRDGKLVREHSYGVDAPLRIVGSPMWKNDDSYVVYNDDKLFSRQQTEELMEGLSEGKPFLFFEPGSQGQMAFTIGNYEMNSGKGGHQMGGIYVPNNDGPLLRYFHAYMKTPGFELNNKEGTQQQFLSMEVRKYLEEWEEADAVFHVARVPSTKDALLVRFNQDKAVVELVRFRL